MASKFDLITKIFVSVGPILNIDIVIPTIRIVCVR